MGRWHVGLVSVMKIVDIFESISGEVGTTILQGESCSFIRFYGCPFACVYCDTPESWHPNTNYKEHTPYELIDMLEKIGNPNVIVTGGEPLMQADIEEFLSELSERAFVKNIVVETAGVCPSFNIHLWGKVSWAVDYKLPSAKSDFLAINTFPFKYLDDSNLIKFLIETEEDLNLAIEKCKTLNDDCRYGIPLLVFSPMNNKGVDKILTRTKEAGIQIVLNVQIHKILGIA